MIILPAIDIKDGACVRLYKGDFSTVHKVAENAVDTAKSFAEQGAKWLHMVDLDGAKDGERKNSKVILDVRKNTSLHIEVGGGIRDMASIEYYLSQGIDRVILGSAAVKNPELVKEAIKEYGVKIAVGIDALNGMVSAEGWTDTSEISFTELAKRMEQIGVSYIIFTDISKDGMLSGPNLNQLDELKAAVSCRIIASGGVANLKDIINLTDLDVYGAICGKSMTTSNLDFIDDYFQKSELIPAIIQEKDTGEVLMLAYMNRESMRKTFETGYTWFYSRSRQELWNKGATSGHLQRVISIKGDCDKDTLLVTVEQTGAACHTGSHSCFFRDLL